MLERQLKPDRNVNAKKRKMAFLLFTEVNLTTNSDEDEKYFLLFLLLLGASGNVFFHFFLLWDYEMIHIPIDFYVNYLVKNAIYILIVWPWTADRRTNASHFSHSELSSPNIQVANRYHVAHNTEAHILSKALVRMIISTKERGVKFSNERS